MGRKGSIHWLWCSLVVMWTSGDRGDFVQYRGVWRYSLQNRRNFLRILGEWRQKGGERKARVAREGRSVKNPLLSSHATRASRSPRFRLYSPKIRKTIPPVLQATDGIAKYIWVEVTTAPCVAVPTIEESLKGNNFRLRFSMTDIEFLEVYKFNNPSCWDLWCSFVFNRSYLTRSVFFYIKIKYI